MPLYAPRPPIDDPWVSQAGTPNRSIPGPIRIPTGGNIPFKPPFWKFNYDDASFWIQKPNQNIPPVRMPAGGGFPFPARFWKNDYDDSSFWTGTPNRSIPEVDETVGGGFPFKPPYWKYNNDDPGFWVGPKTTPPFIPNLSSNYVTTTANIPLPVNCVMMGDQVYESGRTFEGPPKPKLRFKPRMWSPDNK